MILGRRPVSRRGEIACGSAWPGSGIFARFQIEHSFLTDMKFHSIRFAWIPILLFLATAWVLAAGPAPPAAGWPPADSATIPAAAGGGGVLQEQAEDSGSAAETREDAAEGLRIILNDTFLPRDFHQDTFDDLWRDWPEPWRSQAEELDEQGRRALAFRRYGFSPREEEPHKPLQYVVDDEGWWSMNCFACHGGSVAGKAIAGVPNSHIALQTLYSDLRRTKLRRGEELGTMELGSLAVPMGTSNGTTNAVIFGTALMGFRDKDLNLKPNFPRFFTHHDMDAPAWWNVRKRDRLYIDGFVEKNHRALVPFVMDQSNGGAKLRGWEGKFKKVFAYIQSLEAPEYPFEIDEPLAAEGKVLFGEHCSRCHGSYVTRLDSRNIRETYPGRVVLLSEIDTDPVRLEALTPYDRRIYHESWFAHYGEDATVIEPRGYQAPPLDGIWASAPYFHNGSVPTLAGVLDPASRPEVWKRSHAGYDKSRVGLEVQRLESIPRDVRRPDERREYFDSRRRGKGREGHDFAADLGADARRALLEYLKAL